MASYTPYEPGVFRMHIVANIRGSRMPVYVSSDNSLWIFVTEEFQYIESLRGRSWHLGQNIIDTKDFGGNVAWINTFVPPSEERNIFTRRLMQNPGKAATSYKKEYN